MEEVKEEKPVLQELPQKSSMEILSELFGTFDAEPPIIIKKEKDETKHKHKKSKKKHKHKDKKKKKAKKRKREESTSSTNSEVDLGNLLIKQEKTDEKKIKIEGTDYEINLNVKSKTDGNKISISDLKHINIGETSGENDPKPKQKKKHKHDHKEKKKRSRSRSKDRNEASKRIKSNDLRHKIRSNDFYSKCEESFRRNESEERTRDRRRNEFYRDRDKLDEGRTRDDFYRERSRERRRDRSSSRERDSHIDKKKLLEIARKNAIHMMKSGSLPSALTLGPQAQEKVLAAIKAGGKTIEELTDFCKTLSKNEERDLNNFSDKGSDSDTDKPFHHPFQIKDRPTTIIMNIKNSVPLPIKSSSERNSELRMQFPVSSGQQHRKTENEWVPVSPKKSELKTNSGKTEIVPIVPAPPNAPPGPQVFPTPVLEQKIDIGSIVSQRLTAMRRLQENPSDVQALNQIYNSNKEMQTWAQSKQAGQFTGSTGAQILTPAELSSGYQAWAKKDQLQSAAPVSGGMGMHLLQKMGWKPGEGLGKEKTGTLEPLLLEVKLDKKGLVASEEQKKKVKGKPKGGVEVLQGKHPVSLLGEYASKKKIGAPEYVLCLECGPDHKKNFLFKVILNGVEYQPAVASGNKKDAKAAAATVCLQQIGLLPP